MIEITRYNRDKKCNCSVLKRPLNSKQTLMRSLCYVTVIMPGQHVVISVADPEPTHSRSGADP